MGVSAASGGLVALIIATTSVLSQAQDNVSECGVSRGCIYFNRTGASCQPPHCDFYMDYLRQGNESSPVRFTIQGRISDNEYIALGISEDRQMGNDEVHVCNTAGRAMTRYYNPPRRYAPSQIQSGTTNLDIEDISADDGVVRCVFNRESVEVGGGVTNILNLTSPVYLLFAYGNRAGSGGISRHAETPTISSQTVVGPSNKVILLPIITPTEVTPTGSEATPAGSEDAPAGSEAAPTGSAAPSATGPLLITTVTALTILCLR